MPRGISKEIKQEILQGIKSGTPVLAISEQYGVSTKTIYAWLRKSVEEPVSLRELQKLRKENTALKEIIGELTIEKELIKKKSNGR